MSLTFLIYTMETINVFLTELLFLIWQLPETRPTLLIEIGSHSTLYYRHIEMLGEL